MLQYLTEWREFDRSFIFLQKKHAFGVNPRDADHAQLAPDGSRITIASGLRLRKQSIVSPKEGAT